MESQCFVMYAELLTPAKSNQGSSSSGSNRSNISSSSGSGGSGSSRGRYHGVDAPRH